jgi:DNA-binding transcriptional LysR family regulator
MHGAALRYFLEVSRTGSINEASAQLNVAASAISRQVAKLEAAIGSPLFERRPRGMILTPAGELLARHARQTLLDAGHVVSEIRRLRGLAAGLIRLGCTEGFALELVPEAISRFRLTYPGIHFGLQVEPPGAITRLVREGHIDLGVTFVFTPEPGVRVEYQGRAPITALMSPDHPLAAQAEVSLADLAGQAVALPEKDTTVRQLFDLACSQEGVVIEPAFTSNYIGALWSFAEIGAGITPGSTLAVSSRIRSRRLVARTIRTEGTGERRFQVQTLSGRTLPDAVRIFCDEICSYLAAREKVSGALLPAAARD